MRKTSKKPTDDDTASCKDEGVQDDQKSKEEGSDNDTDKNMASEAGENGSEKELSSERRGRKRKVVNASDNGSVNGSDSHSISSSSKKSSKKSKATKIDRSSSRNNKSISYTEKEDQSETENDPDSGSVNGSATKSSASNIKIALKSKAANKKDRSSNRHNKSSISYYEIEDQSDRSEKNSKPKKGKAANKIDEEDVEYEVEAIVDSKTARGKKLYLIKWKGYPSSENTWEAEESVSSPDLLEKFKRENGEESNTSQGRPKSKKAASKNKAPAKAKGKLKDDFDYEADDNQEYEVQKILETHLKKNGKREFLIRWKGWTSNHDSWEPEEHLNCTDLITTFMAKVEKAKASDQKSLRVAPPSTNRFTLTSGKGSGRRLSKRHGDKQRMRYDDAE